jgi:hypothetical protein
MTLIAKPIVDNAYWVVTGAEGKVGNVVATSNGVDFKRGTQVIHYESTKQLQQLEKITFDKFTTSKVNTTQLGGLPAPENTHNHVYELKHKLHLFTDTPKSKSFRAAGWFAVNQNDTTSLMFCPKYIYIQRYEYSGPFATKQEATNSCLEHKQKY